MDMFQKLGELKQKMEVSKQRLDAVTVSGSAGDGAVTITLTGNKKFKSIFIEDALCLPERKDELIDYIELAFESALDAAQEISDKEMMAQGRGLLPNLPGLF